MVDEVDDDDLKGWDIDRDGRMADYEDVPVNALLEPYNPKKDPVNKGLVPDPYGGDDASHATDAPDA